MYNAIILLGDKMEQNYINMQRFFSMDLKIKDLIIKMKPPRLNYGEEFYIKYVDELLQNLKKIEEVYFYFVDYLGMTSDVKDIINDKFKNMELEFINCNYKIENLEKVYEKYIYSMSYDAIKEINENFYGYSVNRKEYEVLSKCNTVNDMLHAFHSYLVNNEDFYQNIPIIEIKHINEYEDEINLCGKKTELSKELFDSFPTEINSCKTDILSFDDMILVMCRDIGHALTIEIHDEGDNLRVNYYIPKVCNVEKVNTLKGVNKLNPETSNMFSVTNGEFVVKKESFIPEIVDFIKSVPTDDDIMSMIKFY